MYRIVERLKVETFAQKEFNNLLHIDSRELIGSSLRWKLIANSLAGKKARLYLGIGVMYEHEAIENSPQESIKLIRSTNYLSFNIDLAERSKISAVIYYQPAFADFKDYRILWEMKAVFEISKNVAFETKYQTRFDNEPPKDVVSPHSRWVSGITFSF